MKLDDFLVSKGKAAFQALIDNAQDYDDNTAYLPKNSKSEKSKWRKRLTAYEVAERLCKDEKLIYSAGSFYVYQDGVYRFCDDAVVRCGRPREWGQLWPRWFSHERNDAPGNPFY